MPTLELNVGLERGGFTLAVNETLELDAITAVFGPSGSGKTTLLRIIAGLEPAAGGSLAFGGKTWLDPNASVPPEQRAIGMVFQDGRLFAHLDVRDNLMFPIRHGRRTGAIGFDDTVRALELDPLLARDTASLSGGERQRVAIARALLTNPALLLMDEPLSSLDRNRKRELLPLIRSLPERFGVPVLYVTHDVDELIYLASEVLLQEQGRIVSRGGPREIFLGSDFSIIEAEVAGHADDLTTVRFGPAELRVPRAPLAPGETLRLRIDSRDVILATAAPTGISIRNRLETTVRGIEAGDDGLVDVELDAGGQRLMARITADAARELELAPGRNVYALIKTVALGAP